MVTKKIYFVRHGEAAGNVGAFTQTPTTPLTDVGHQQAKVVAERFRHLPIEAVLASSMDRAQDTARYIAEVAGCPLETSEFFHEVMRPTSVREVSHESEVYRQFQAAEAEHYTDPNWRFEDGENFADILIRATEGIAMLESKKESHIVVVSHGRFLRFITSYLLHQKQLTPAIEYVTAHALKAHNTGITLFEYHDSRWKLVTWNDTAHFAE